MKENIVLNSKRFDPNDLDDYHWDCECEVDYIHPNTENVCTLCGANMDEQPSSLALEVKAFLKKTAEDLNNVPKDNEQ